MDDQRFDRLTRSLAAGASRRSLIRGLLGLGGAAVSGAIVSNSADARGGSVTRITTPPPPACRTGQSICGSGCCPTGRCSNGFCCNTAGQERCGSLDACCDPGECLKNGSCCSAGEDRCHNEDLCCPSGTCSRIGNTDACCPASNLVSRSGECCDIVQRNCDTDCCRPDELCLTRVFSGQGLPEETCCPTALTCDNQCCTGECYDPSGAMKPSGTSFDPDQLALACCPAGFEVCANPDGTRACIDPAIQCCGVDDCVAGGLDADCVTCNQAKFCEAINAGLTCNGSECGTCQIGRCLATASNCTDPCAPCSANLVCEPVSCPAGQRCCGGSCAECCDNGDCPSDEGQICETGSCCQSAGRCNPSNHRCCGACNLGGPDNTGFCGAIQLCGGIQCPVGQRCCGDICAECCDNGDCPSDEGQICETGSCCQSAGRCNPSNHRCCGACNL